MRRMDGGCGTNSRHWFTTYGEPGNHVEKCQRCGATRPRTYTPAQAREAVANLRALAYVSECSNDEPADKTCRTANKPREEWCVACIVNAFLERIGEAHTQAPPPPLGRELDSKGDS